MPTDLGDYLLGYEIKQGGSKASETATAIIDNLDTVYTVDQEVTLEGRNFFISEVSREMTQKNTWVQRLLLTSPLAKVRKKSPKKKQIFMTMSADDYEDFQSGLKGGTADLDYVPRIKMGDEHGDNGWTAHEIIRAMASMAGITVNVALPDFAVKQHTITSGQTFLDSILGLVAPFDPLYYSVGGQIFIIESGILERDFGSGNVYTLQNPTFIREEVRRKNKPTQIKVVGELGSFRPEKYKGYTNTAMETVTSQVGQFTVQNTVYGIEEESSYNQVGPSGIFLNSTQIDPNTGIIEGWSIDRLATRYGKDVFGNRGNVVDTHEITYKRRYYNNINYGVILFRVVRSATRWENTHYKYTNPRAYGNIVGQAYLDVPGKYESLDQAVWYPSGSQATFGLYQNLEERYTYFWYKENGDLVKQSTVTWGIVYTDDNETYTRLQDLYSEDDVSPTGTLKRVITRTETLTYTQVSIDTYAEQQTWADLNPDGSYAQGVADIRHVQAGAVQGSRPQFRTMRVLAESGAAQTGNASDMSAVMDTPAREIGIKTPNWAAVEAVEPLLRDKLTRDEVIRTYRVPSELNIHLGLQVEMPAETHHQGQQIPAPTLASGYKPIVVGYAINNDLETGQAFTELTLKARLQ